MTAAMILAETIQRVSVENDFWIYATDLCVAAAAVLALVSIVYSGRLERRSEAAAARERRADFELGLLAQISDVYSRTGLPYITGYVRALIRSDKNHTDLLVLRHQLQVHPNTSTAAADSWLVVESRSHGKERTYADQDLQDMRAAAIPREIAEAIERRISVLPDTPA